VRTALPFKVAKFSRVPPASRHTEPILFFLSPITHQKPSPTRRQPLGLGMPTLPAPTRIPPFSEYIRKPFFFLEGALHFRPSSFPLSLLLLISAYFFPCVSFSEAISSFFLISCARKLFPCGFMFCLSFCLIKSFGPSSSSVSFSSSEISICPARYFSVRPVTPGH